MITFIFLFDILYFDLLLVSGRLFGILIKKIHIKLILNFAQLIFSLVKFNTYSHAMSPNSFRSKNRYIYIP